MVLNEKTLDQWLAARCVVLPDDIRNAIMETYGNEPGDGYAWSEQDIYEQVRKIIEKHKKNNF